MEFSFSDFMPEALNFSPEVISGPESFELPGKEFLLKHENGELKEVYEIRYLTWGGPYKEATVFENYLAVGHYQFLYFYDLINRFNILRFEVNGYFGHLHIHNGLLYVTDSACIYCYGKNSKLNWCSSTLGIDGVLISKFTNDHIIGSAQLDPPDGWEDFKLNIKSGQIINSG